MMLWPATRTTFRGKPTIPVLPLPLYDAIGKTVSKLNAQVGPNDHVLVTIITDGAENCSTEWNLQMVRNLIEKLKQQKWTFTLIGTDNLDVEGMAHSMCIDEHMDFTEDAVSTKAMFVRERKARVRYNCSVQKGEAVPLGSFFKDEE